MSERYTAVGEFIDLHPDATLDPTVRHIISAARDIPAHRLVCDRREVDRLRAVAMAELDGVDALVVPTAPMHPRIDEVAADPVGVNSRLGTYTNFWLFDMCAVAVPAGTAGQSNSTTAHGEPRSAVTGPLPTDRTSPRTAAGQRPSRPGRSSTNVECGVMSRSFAHDVHQPHTRQLAA